MVARARETGAIRTLAAMCVAALLFLVLSCGGDGVGDDPASVKGKTPVVEPEDLAGAAAPVGRGVVLAPDYRQGASGASERGDLGLHDPGVGALFAEGGDTAARPGASGRPAAPAPAAPGQPGGAAAPGQSGQSGRTGSPASAGAASGGKPSLQAAAPGAPAGAIGAIGASGAGGPGGPVGPGGAGGAGLSAPTGATGDPGGRRQLLVALAPRLDAVRGTLRRYEKTAPDAAWTKVGGDMPCVFGRGGLAWGRGLAAPPEAAPAKREGDGRTPAGLFALPLAFGQEAVEAAKKRGLKMPYHHLSGRAVCVTDPDSPLFNTLAETPAGREGGFSRYDRMIRESGANRLGLFIGHNVAPSQAGAGSCVFLNIGPAGGGPTGGSLGLAENDLLAVMAWLDPAAGPLLAVAPEDRLPALRGPWSLP